MAINPIIGSGGTLFGQAVQNLNTQLTDLSTQLATGKKSTTYSGFGVGEALRRRSIAALQHFRVCDTITNVNTIINTANTALAVALEVKRPGAERCGLDAAEPQQQRSNDRAAERGERADFDRGNSQHPGRRPFHIFRQRD